MTPLEEVETLTSELWGMGSNVSVDQAEGGKWVVRCWDRKGKMVEETTPRDKHGAISAMRTSLRLAIVTKEETNFKEVEDDSY